MHRKGSIIQGESSSIQARQSVLSPGLEKAKAPFPIQPPSLLPRDLKEAARPAWGSGRIAARGRDPGRQKRPSRRDALSFLPGKPAIPSRGAGQTRKPLRCRATLLLRPRDPPTPPPLSERSCPSAASSSPRTSRRWCCASQSCCPSSR